MLNVNEYYYGGFNDFYPLWGIPIASAWTSSTAVQVKNNSFTGESVGDGNYVNVNRPWRYLAMPYIAAPRPPSPVPLSMQGNI